jgi:hypothetical protein
MPYKRSDPTLYDTVLEDLEHQSSPIKISQWKISEMFSKREILHWNSQENYWL